MGMKKLKIVVTSPMNFFLTQKKRLKNLGNIKIYNTLPESPDDWLKRCEGADIICSGKYGLQDKIYKLKNVFISLPFVAVGWLDKEKLKERNIVVSYCPGCNRHAVSEWIITMMLLLMRKLHKLIKVQKLDDRAGSKEYLGLAGKEVCILGNGNVGGRVGEVCKALEMKVSYFQRGDDIINKTKTADVVIDALGHNPTTEGLLDNNFFNTLKKGSIFITVTSSKIFDSEAMIRSLDRGILSGVATDVGSALPGNVNDPDYKKLIKHPKVIVTPHISYQSDVTIKLSNDMMIDNIEAYIKGKPINVVN
jgi:phosphoglycerate dehydrogenase-like enzyme